MKIENTAVAEVAKYYLFHSEYLSAILSGSLPEENLPGKA